MDLRNKVIVITGASRGLGKELAMQLFKQGAKLVLGSRSKDELSDLAAKTNALYSVIDVKIKAEVRELANMAITKLGSIDVWINNAGIIMPQSPAEDMDSDRVHEVMEVNLFGTLYGSSESIKQMKKQKYGTVVNISSAAGLEGKKGLSGYVATKFAVSGFTKSIRLETEPFNIKVICVYPGGIKTNLFDEERPKSFEDFMDPSLVARKIIQNIKKEIPKEELVLRRRKPKL